MIRTLLVLFVVRSLQLRIGSPGAPRTPLRSVSSKWGRGADGHGLVTVGHSFHGRMRSRFIKFSNSARRPELARRTRVPCVIHTL